jgi:hypothetical protein
VANITDFVALPILRSEDGHLYAGEPFEARSDREAKSRASSLTGMAGNVGAVAFSRTGDPSTGEFEPAVILAKHGDLPADIVEMTL